MGATPTPRAEGWTIASTEALLESLTGVVSARIVAKPGGEIEEIHLLTTEEVAPKQTVRNVESALLAHFDLEVDHRKISVARTSAHKKPEAEPTPPKPTVPQEPEALPLRAIQASAPGGRFLFVGHQVETERSHMLRMRVTLMLAEERFEGEASGTDLPRARLETVANATIRCVERALGVGSPEGRRLSLQLDGVKTVEAFDRRFVLVSVHALTGREVHALAGAAAIDESPDRAVILATLQATDRWARGRM
ncbi:MAG: hypothetical protein ACF8Q5_13445 [Phycisphaerales bacterium JB040]